MNEIGFSGRPFLGRLEDEARGGGLEPVRAYVDNFFISLEMVGATLTVSPCGDGCGGLAFAGRAAPVEFRRHLRQLDVWEAGAALGAVDPASA